MVASVATQAILATAEKNLNRLLKTDNLASERLAKLAGKVIAIQSNFPTYTVFITLTEQGIYLTSELNTPSDCKITAPLPLLIQLLLSKNKQKLLESSSLMLVGEAPLIHNFCKVLEDLNPDWKNELSQWVNPDITEWIALPLKAGAEQIGAGVNFLKQQFSHLINTVTSTDSYKKNSTSNPAVDLLGALQKKFRQS